MIDTPHDLPDTFDDDVLSEPETDSPGFQPDRPGLETDRIAPRTLTTGPGDTGLRLDKVLATHCPDFSRSRLKALIEGGAVTQNGTPMTDPAYKIPSAGPVTLCLTPPAPLDDTPVPENIPLDILYEDDDLIVINKSADMVVHPAAGHASGTLVNAVLYHCGDTLSGIGGVKRPGIVHRLDRGTSGAILVAKNDFTHLALQEQLSTRTMGRVYHCVTFQCPLPPVGKIEAPIGRHKTNRLKMTVGGADARTAITHYKVRARGPGDSVARVECRLETGRTHQIRVHLASIGNPLVGDPLYGPQDTALRAALKKGGYSQESIHLALSFPRQALHAAEIHFVHPRSLKNISLESPFPDDFLELIKILNLAPTPSG